jgi:hypothetical protein
MISFMLLLLPLSAQKHTVQLKDGFFYIDGQKFFVEGIGYEVGAYPGMLPWNRPFNEDVLRHDMSRIREAGFNTIRTWNAFTNNEMKVIQNYDLKIIMGIWVDPEGDFSSSQFVASSLQSVTNIINYTRNYDNIIGYLIMNEPLPDHIFSTGFGDTYTLWMKIKRLIHEMHPGIPVSFANTCTGDFIDPDIFDFSAANVYPYNPSTVNFSYQYAPYIEYLHSLRHDNHPLIITEYGLSVSPSGEGNWGYGGNSDEEQVSGILYMYRSLLDGGAGGSCVFNYSDGWWKAGDEYTHNDAAEEWFGLVEYENVSDKYGTIRPVWDSLRNYNQAVIVSPKNQQIYGQNVPFEIFSSDSITRFTAIINKTKILDTTITGNYFHDTIYLGTKAIRDILMKFVFYNKFNRAVKSENIQFLQSDDAIQLPEILINVTPNPVKGNHSIKTTYGLLNQGPLTADSLIDFSFYTHIGWDYGVKGSARITDQNPVHSETYYYDNNVNVITISAGMDAYYGDFKKRIVQQRVFILGDTSYVEIPTLINTNNIIDHQIFIYPNPAQEYIYYSDYGINVKSYSILRSDGSVVSCGNANAESPIEIKYLPSGLYLIAISDKEGKSYISSFAKE